MDSILKIFQEVAENEGLKIGTLERAIGASKGVISRAINNGSDVQSKWFQALVEKYPHYDYQKMLLGNPPQEIKDPEILTLESVRDDLKAEMQKDLDEMKSNFNVIHEALFQSMKGQRKLLNFIEKLDANTLAELLDKLKEETVKVEVKGKNVNK